LKEYLKPTRFIDSDNPYIKSLCQGMVDSYMSQIQKARKLFEYVRDGVHYDMYSASSDPDSYIASSIIKKGRGYCVQKAIALAALGRAVGIPSRIVLVAIKNHKAPREAIEVMKTNIFFPHAYNQFFLNSKWVSVAATFDRDICERIGVPTVQFNGIDDALLPQTDKDGSPYIEYVDKYGAFEDFPLEYVMRKMAEYYGEDYRTWF